MDWIKLSYYNLSQLNFMGLAGDLCVEVLDVKNLSGLKPCQNKSAYEQLYQSKNHSAVEIFGTENVDLNLWASRE